MTVAGSAEELARAFHESYERLAPSFGYETRPESAVEWADLPEPNRSLMVAVADDVIVNGPVFASVWEAASARVEADRRLVRETNFAELESLRGKIRELRGFLRCGQCFDSPAVGEVTVDEWLAGHRPHVG